MNLLLKHYQKIIQTVEDVEELKKHILDLAIKGKLVDQDPKDESASILIGKIEVEKERLVKKKIIRTHKKLPIITDNEKPSELPDGWEWIRVAHVFQINPRNKLDDNKIVSFIPMRLVEDGLVNKHYSEEREWKSVKSGYTHFQENDIAVAKITPCFENRKSVVVKNLIGGFGAGTTELYILRSYINEILPEFFLYLFKSKKFIDDGVNTFTGTAGHQRVKRDFIENYVVGLPPIEEQRRIVNKIKRLFIMCDQLTEQIRSKSNSSLKLNKTILNRIQDASNPTQKEDLIFAIQNMESLCNTKHDVQLLRESILSLAVQGKLVKQDSNDESVSALIKKIEKEREQLIHTKQIRRPRKLPEITDEEKPYDLPEGWKWIRLSDFGQIIGGGTPKTKEPRYWADSGKGIPWITPADIGSKQKTAISRGRRDITELGLKNSSTRILPKGSVLFSSRAPIGYVAIAENDICTNQGFKSILPYEMEMNRYIFYYLKWAGEKINDRASGTTFKEVSGREMEKQLFPLPPLAEQKRIVVKIDDLFNLCNELEERLEKKKVFSKRLRNAVLDGNISNNHLNKTIVS